MGLAGAAAASRGRKAGRNRERASKARNDGAAYTPATKGSPASQNTQSTAMSENTQDNHHEKKKLSIRYIRHVCGKIVNNEHFQSLIVTLIVINSIMMGIATFDSVSENPRLNTAFQKTDMAFLIVFTVELAIQFIHYGLHLFMDGWLVFDFILVVLSWSLESLQIVRTFRIFRAARLITRVQVLKNLVGALLSVGPRMSAISALLALIFYIFAVMMTTLYGNLYEQGFTEFDYFSRLDKTLWTLFVMMTLEWADVVREVMDVYPNAWMPFLSFIMVTAFIVYNLIIAVVCDAVAVQEHEHEENLREQEEEATAQLCKLRGRIDKLQLQQQDVVAALGALVEELGIDLEAEQHKEEEKSELEPAAVGTIRSSRSLMEGRIEETSETDYEEASSQAYELVVDTGDVDFANGTDQSGIFEAETGVANTTEEDFLVDTGDAEFGGGGCQSVDDQTELMS